MQSAGEISHVFLLENNYPGHINQLSCLHLGSQGRYLNEPQLEAPLLSWPHRNGRSLQKIIERWCSMTFPRIWGKSPDLQGVLPHSPGYKQPAVARLLRKYLGEAYGWAAWGQALIFRDPEFGFGNLPPPQSHMFPPFCLQAAFSQCFSLPQSQEIKCFPSMGKRF